MKVPNPSKQQPYKKLSLSRLQNEGSQLERALVLAFLKSIKATE